MFNLHFIDKQNKYNRKKLITKVKIESCRP